LQNNIKNTANGVGYYSSFSPLPLATSLIQDMILSRDVPSTRQLHDGQVLDIIFKTRLLPGTRRNIKFLPGSYSVDSVKRFTHTTVRHK
jgi:hypothetical protein